MSALQNWYTDRKYLKINYKLKYENNHQECPTVLSKEFKKIYSCFIQVKFYLKKLTQSAVSANTS